MNRKSKPQRRDRMIEDDEQKSKPQRGERMIEDRWHIYSFMGMLDYI